MRLLFALLWMLFCSLQVSAQRKKEVRDFLKLFPKTTLPVCYQYDNSALVWDDEYGIEIGLKDKDSTFLLTESLAQKYLLKANESVFINLESDSSTYRFYALHLVAKSAAYFAVTYERRYSDSWNPESAEIFLVTLNKDGKLISKVEIASFNYGGTFLYDDSEKQELLNRKETDNTILEEETDSESLEQKTYLRLPYFPRTSGCIFGNSVQIKSERIPTETHYQIDKNGTISKIK